MQEDFGTKKLHNKNLKNHKKMRLSNDLHFSCLNFLAYLIPKGNILYEKNLLTSMCALFALTLSGAPKQSDPGVLAVKGKGIDYTGVYPAHIKTIAVITPASDVFLHGELFVSSGQLIIFPFSLM